MKLPRFGFWLPALLASLAFVSPLRADSLSNPDRAAWMQEARFGVMTHFLHDWITGREHRDQMTPENWNKLVDGFDVEACADQLKSVGAHYYIITIGQNSGYYLSPNATYDKITGINPSKISRRDLVADLAAAVAKRGIRLMVYLPSGAPAGDRVADQALKWQNGPYRNAEFQRNWEAVIREWSSRWGNKVSGWWFDGCFWPNAMYRGEAPNFETFAAAARAGNPDSALAFCPGQVHRALSLAPQEDYIAGEVSKLDWWSVRRQAEGKFDGAQLHVLTYLGQDWGRGTPRFSTEEAVAFSLKVVAERGAISWDTPTQTNGTFAPEYLAQLKAIGDAVAAAKIPPSAPAPAR
jgi:alpha-L-fucosidase